MSNEHIDISGGEIENLSSLLKGQGLNETDIGRIINGEYQSFETGEDLEKAFGGIRKHGSILEKLSDGYTMEELQSQGISSEQLQAFNDMLGDRNLTVDNAKAIYQYSIGSNMILGVKRGTTKETIQQQIMEDMQEALRSRGVSESDIEKMGKLVESTDYQLPLHNNYDLANQYMEQSALQPNSRVSVRSAMQSMDRCTHIDETISALEDGIGRTNLPESMKLYRAVKSSYLQKGLADGEDLRSLIGKSISNKGQTSTSPIYDSSFASLDDYDTVFEIYAPKGTRGSYIAELSAYDKTEQEVLLNPNDLYITDVQTGVVDKNGKTKNVLQAICLSKDRECYKGIGREESSISEQQPTTSIDTNTNLPKKQNRFTKWFSQFRAKFARDTREDVGSGQPVTDNAKVEQEHKAWELEPEEKSRIQKETAEIAKRHREQEEQGQQQPQKTTDEQSIESTEEMQL